MPSNRIPPDSGSSAPADPTGSFASYLSANLESEIYAAARAGSDGQTAGGVQSGLKLGPLALSLMAVTIVVIVGMAAIRLVPAVRSAQPPQPSGSIPKSNIIAPQQSPNGGSSDTLPLFKESKGDFSFQRSTPRQSPIGKSREVQAVVVD